jgi:hypothetical protein
MLHHQQSNPRVSLFFDSYSCCFGQIISCQGSDAFSSDFCHHHAVTGCRIFFSMVFLLLLVRGLLCKKLFVLFKSNNVFVLHLIPEGKCKSACLVYFLFYQYILHLQEELCNFHRSAVLTTCVS